MKTLTVLLLSFLGLCGVNAQDTEEFVFNYYVCETDNCITLEPNLGDTDEQSIDCFTWESEDDI